MRRHRRLYRPRNDTSVHDGQPDLLPLDALLTDVQADNHDALLYVQSADVVVGVDETTGNHFVVYGQRAMEERASTNGQPLLVAYIGLRLGIGELEQLRLLVREIKGEEPEAPAR